MKFRRSSNVYAHIDCNSFYASCEVFRNPSLAGKRVCVGGDIIIAASYEAKRLGIKTGTPIWEAKRILGGTGVFIRPDMDLYKRISRRFTDFISGYANMMEIFSIDEAFLDITGVAAYHGMDELSFCVFLKKEIRRCIGIPVSIGVSDTRIRAKILSDIHKPFGELVAFDDAAISGIFSGLKVTDTPFIGKRMGERLKYIAKTIEDFRRLTFWKVDELMGKNGTDLWLELNGVDVMSFAGNPMPKSITRTRSFNHAMTDDRDFLWSEILLHFSSALRTLNKHNLELRIIAIYLRDEHFARYSYPYRFPEYTNLHSDLLMGLRKVFSGELVSGLRYRSTGVIMYDFREAVPKQLSMEDLRNRDFEKNKKLLSTIEAINGRYAGKIVGIGTDAGVKGFSRLRGR